jgi:hypothetical protein
LHWLLESAVLIFISCAWKTRVFHVILHFKIVKDMNIKHTIINGNSRQMSDERGQKQKRSFESGVAKVDDKLNFEY